MKIKTKAVLFDLDGTLCATAADAHRCLNLARQSIGLGPIDYAGLMVGINDAGISFIRKCLPEGTKDQEVQRCFERYCEEYDRGCTVETTVYPGMLDLVVRLKEMGIARAVYTNKPHDQAVRVISHLFPAGAFDEVLGFGAFAAKPDPAGAIALMNKFGALPCETLYVGDSDTDMITSRNAQTVTVGVAWGYRPPEMLEKLGARFIARESGMEILQLIAGGEA